MGLNGKKSFVLYTDYGKYFARLSVSERGELITAIFAYQEDGSEPENLSPAAGMAFCFMRAQLDRDNAKYDERAERSRENGKKGGRPKPNQTQWVSEEPNETLNDNDIDNENDTENDTEKETLSPPASPSAAPDSVGTPLKERISSKQLEEEFDRLWKVYPRKEGKKGAKAAFEKVRKRGVTFEEIERGVKRYAEVAGQREMKYIKHGSTWFAGECWNDEVKEDGYRRDAESESYDYYAALLADTFL